MELEKILLNPKLLAVTAILAYYLIVKNLYAKTPKKSEAGKNTPPAGISPAIAACIYSGELSDRAIRAAYASIGIKGYNLTPDQKTAGLSVTFEARSESAEAKLTGEEKLLLVIGKVNEKKNIASGLFTDFIKIETGKYYTEVSEYFKIGLYISIIAAVFGMFFGVSGGRGIFNLFEVIFLSVWLGGWTVGTTILVVLAAVSIREFFKKPEKKNFIPALIFTLFSLPFLFAEFQAGAQLLAITDLGTFLFLIALAGINLYFRNKLKIYTEEGLRVLQELLSFKEYLTHKGREDMLETVSITSSLYEKHLPYAIALDAEHGWRDRFNSFAEGATYIPSWYKGEEKSLKWIINSPIYIRLLYKVVFIIVNKLSKVQKT